MILMPALDSRPRYARVIVCKNNLKQWGIIFAMYCIDNNERFSPGTAGNSERDDWLISLKSYYKDKEEILICPSAKKRREDGKDYGGTNNSYQVSIEKQGSKKISIESSYGINAWHYNPPSDSNIFASHSAENFWRTNLQRELYKIPMLADAMWPGGCPEPEGTAGQPPDENGQWSGVDAEMNHFCIDRHNDRINVLFMDGHVETVRLKELWKLKWHKNFDTNGEWTQPDAPWPEWMKNLKE
jgi:prepilin-type processing-associated H-X9-DG protein